MREEAVYWLWLSGMEALTRKRIRKLLEYFGTPYDIYMAGDKEILPLLPKNLQSDWGRLRNLDLTVKQMEELKAANISFIYRGHSLYPEKLEKIPDAPMSLFVKGRLPPKGSKNIAVIGSREASVYGTEIAGYFARRLAEHGVGVVSGLAAGIDGAGHRGALAGKGYTLGVIGGGIDSIYPRENYDLYQELERLGGIVSEYPPHVKPLAFQFPERNRLISGISDGVLVVEAKEKSGTFITVDQGLEQGKNIYAVPGRITDKNSIGCIRLIRDGAIPVVDVGDILEELNIRPLENDNFLKQAEVREKTLAKAEKIVYSCLSLEPTYVEDIILSCGMSVSDTLNILLSLELRGFIRQIVKNFYVRVYNG